MKSLFDTETYNEVKQRLNNLTEQSPRQWGKMESAQMLAHCSEAIKMALGEVRPPRMWLGRIIGLVVKPLVFRNDGPMRPNSPTVKGLEVEDNRDLETERSRLLGLVERFSVTGPKEFTKYPHSFFGRLTPQEWAILMYKHLDHHLRQFGV